MSNTASANLGGVYSLFIGMSVLSFIEIFYFFTVRLYKHYKDVQGRELRRQEMLKNGGHVVKKKIKYGESFYHDACILPDKRKKVESAASDETLIVRGFIN